MKKVVLLVLGLLLITSVFAELNFYAHVRTGWWYEMLDEDYTGSEEARTNFDYSLYGCSRFGAKYTADNYVLGTEFGISSSNVNLRHLYGEYKFEKFSILIGQTWTGLNEFSCQTIDGDNGFIGTGLFYDGRLPQLTFKFSNAYVSFMDPKKSDPQNIGTGGGDALLPKINLGYRYKDNGIYVHPSFGINMSNYNEDFAGEGNDQAVTAIVFSLTAKYAQDKFDVAGQFNYGQNAGDYGIAGCAYMAGFDGEDVVNVITTGGYGQVGYQINDKAKLTAGFGFLSQEYDVDDSEADTKSSLFVQTKITLADNVWIVPEIGMVDYADDMGGETEGARTYFGTKFEMRFSN